MPYFDACFWLLSGIYCWLPRKIGPSKIVQLKILGTLFPNTGLDLFLVITNNVCQFQIVHYGMNTHVKIKIKIKIIIINIIIIVQFGSSLTIYVFFRLYTVA